MGYYIKFVKNYGRIAYPLTQQLKKDNFAWVEDAQMEPFEQLKKAMTMILVIAFQDFKTPL